MGKWRKPAKHTVIEPQWKGIFATCNRGRELQCAREIREWFEATAEEVWGGNAPADEDNGEGSIEDAIQKEVESLTATKRKLIVVHAKLGVDCVVFIQCRHPVDPVKLTRLVCAEAQQGKRTPRYIQKLSPVQQFIKCEEGLDGIEAFKPVIGTIEKGKKFAIRPTLRLSPVTRDKVIPAIARLVGPDNSVDLKHFDTLIMAEGLRGILGVAVVPVNATEFESFCKFNLVQISAARAQKEVDTTTSTAATASAAGTENNA